MSQDHNPVSRQKDIVIQELQGEILIYDLNINKAFCLNETSALVWQSCDGKKSVSEISSGLSKTLNQPINEDLVWLAIEQLKQENLLLNGEKVKTNFNGLSRRKAIKKAGIVAVTSLPLITSLVAPVPANAASAGTCTAIGQPCTNSDQCCPGPITGTKVCDTGSGDNICIDGIPG